MRICKIVTSSGERLRAQRRCGPERACVSRGNSQVFRHANFMTSGALGNPTRGNASAIGIATCQRKHDGDRLCCKSIGPHIVIKCGQLCSNTCRCHRILRRPLWTLLTVFGASVDRTHLAGRKSWTTTSAENVPNGLVTICGTTQHRIGLLDPSH